MQNRSLTFAKRCILECQSQFDSDNMGFPEPFLNYKIKGFLVGQGVMVTYCVTDENENNVFTNDWAVFIP